MPAAVAARWPPRARGPARETPERDAGQRSRNGRGATLSALKTVDDKGRVTLGREFAGRTVQVERAGDDLVIRFRRVVPDREAWLWENEAAKSMVDRGLVQARSGELGDGPDLAGAFAFAFAFADGLADEE